ncbi:alanine racemase [Kribbella sp. GL6]|uniref:alanine racemase n=1 Tax=Kribbella sp. GL6 TaxID=3419765 RepID=UPI003D054BE7
MIDLALLQNERTPAFVIDADAVRRNIDEVLRRVGDPRGWRCHVKTARSTWGYRLLLERGLTRFKCSTVEELRALAEAGAPDVLLAFPAVGPTQHAVAEVARRHPEVRVSALVDSIAALETWIPPVEVFVDVDTGMHRTGVPIEDTAAVLRLARDVVDRGYRFRGLHSYDGHLADAPREDLLTWDQRLLAETAAALADAGCPPDEVVMGSSHTFTDVLDEPWTGPGERTVGPGTVLYNDGRSLQRFGQNSGFAPAAGVLTRVVSVAGDRVTTDAGLASAQVDAGRPHVQVADRPDLEVVSVAQEHLVLRRTREPVTVGDLLLLVPMHVDTAIIQFDRLLIADTDITSVPAVGRWTR